MNAKKRQYLELVRDNPVMFGKWAGFTDLVSIHNDWIKSFLYDDDDQTLLAHRGSFKTTCLAIAIALLIVLLPNKNIIFFRKTDTDVIEIVVQVSKILQSEHMKALVWALYDVELVLTKNTSWEIDTNLKTSSRGTSQLLGMGIGASLTGKHGDIVITDDIVNLKDRISKAERERTKSAYMELQNVKNRGGRFVNTGTPWHKDDAISSMPNVRRFTCFETGLMSKSDVEHLRSVMTPSLFTANYELKHIADEDALFAGPNYTSEYSLIHDGVAHIDAGYQGGDKTAFTIMKKLPSGKYIAFGKCWDKHVDDCLNEIQILHSKYLAGTIHVETNADKGYLAKEIRKNKLVTYEYHESMNKFIKISTYLRKNWGDIEWLDTTDAEYMSDILDYTENAAFDDCPDSAASLIRALSKDKPKRVDPRKVINRFKKLGL